jgi:hypothetical protein
VFTDRDPFFFIDIDDCIDPQGGWNLEALTLVSAFPGCAIEVSQSGRGLHIIGTQTEAIPAACGMKFFTNKRYVALTGTNATGDAGHAPEGYKEAISRHFPPAPAPTMETRWTVGPVAEWTGPVDDGELITKACASGSQLKACRFVDLWTGNTKVLATVYPSDRNAFDHSRADAALCAHLAFWTGRDCARIERLFELSGLMRDKWENRPEYRSDTILRAVEYCQTVYIMPKASVASVPAASNSLVAYESLAEYFKGCVYIQRSHEVYMPDETIISPEQFKTQMSLGNVFAQSFDWKKTTRNAWLAFSERDHMNVYDVQFRPDVAEKTWVDRGRAYINTFRLWDESWFQEGDVTPFLDHLKRILPDSMDREILIGYLAACVQYPGTKFKWCPVIQGMEGNGKSFIAYALSKVMGDREYVHTVNASDLGNKFNGWAGSKLLAVVDDLQPVRDHDVLGALKRLVTEETIEIQRKGKDQVSSPVFVNLIITSNFKDVLPKTETERRFCMLFTAQQNPGDLEASGLTPEYFVDLWDWFKVRGGKAAVAYYLKHYPIPLRRDPSKLAQTAPRTSTTEEAIQSSQGSIDVSILTAIEEEQSGFRGGWVSSIALRNLCKGKGVRTYGAVMKRLGYIPHPGLSRGAATSRIMQEMGRPTLYVRYDSPLLDMTGDLTKKYIDDNYS